MIEILQSYIETWSKCPYHKRLTRVGWGGVGVDWSGVGWGGVGWEEITTKQCSTMLAGT